MKNIFRVLGIAALAVAIGFSMMSCGDGDDGGGLDGTWVAPGEEMSLNNGNFFASIGGIPAMQGVYTASGGSMTMTITSVWGPYFNPSLASQWYTRAEVQALGANAAQLNQIFSSWTATYSVNGNSLIMILDGEATTYTRK